MTPSEDWEAPMMTRAKSWLYTTIRHFLSIHKISDASSRYIILRRNITLIMLFVTIVPLTVMGAINHFQYQESLKNEVIEPLRVLLNKTRHSFHLFLEERLSMIRFISSAYTFEQLSDPATLNRLYRVLKNEFEGFVDIGLINGKGLQIGYAGPYSLENKDYSQQAWFQEVLIRDSFISEVFMGYGKVPHIAIAVQRVEHDGTYWMLRATIDTNKFDEIISTMEIDAKSDAFIVNREGLFQTHSRYYGDVLGKSPFEILQGAYETTIDETVDPLGREVIVAYASFEKPNFSLVVVKPKDIILRTWITLQGEMFFIFFASVFVIIMIVIKLSDVMVMNIKEAEERRENAIHELEQNQKLSAIGRLAAGVAHEINNPLAIINEKAGLMKDLVTYSPDFEKKQRFLDLLTSIINSVGRCKTITHRLLGFARHKEPRLEPLDINHLVQEVVGFVNKEMVYRNIDLRTEFAEDLPRVLADQGQVQQVFLNILSNALSAVHDNGRVSITSWEEDKRNVGVSIQDNGSGMTEKTIQRIFDPFFTTKKAGGTGLGLFITYGIVKKLGGDIKVHSRENEGSTFTIYLPKVNGETDKEKAE